MAEPVMNAQPMRKFEAPGPGSWALDAAHCSRPRSRYLDELFRASCTRGFRAGFERAGAMLETIEYASVNGFAYMAVRPLGAPLDAKGPPPAFALWLLARLHPRLRQRTRRAAQVLVTRPWRSEVTDFYDRVGPALEDELIAVGSRRIDDANTTTLLLYLEAVHTLGVAIVFDHFRQSGTAMLPVGDFLARTVSWTGARPQELLMLLRGASPKSTEAAHELGGVLEALLADPGATAIIESSIDARQKLDALRFRPGATGDVVRGWLERFGNRVVTGHDIAERRAIEMPESLIACLSTRRGAGTAPLDVGAQTQAVRERVPESHRAEFDALLEEARLVHGLRDARAVLDLWGLGVIRRAVLEAGRRLADAGRLESAEHAVDLTHAELVSLLNGGPGPSAAEVAAHAAWRTTTTAKDAPAFLGREPGRRPESNWLPEAAARIDRAFQAYVTAMNEETERTSTATVVSGLPASPGVYSGTARIVLRADDFVRVHRGDVLVAWATTPTYNVLLPLLGALVTDRGGLLSHPAIVAREFGIPGVVGCREATVRIPDGARVEVDGDRGTVTVLS